VAFARASSPTSVPTSTSCLPAGKLSSSARKSANHGAPCRT
jgi:hypothetical protein